MASSPAQVFTLDDHSRGLEASREQVAALFQSINAPHVVVPGKRAGPAQAFIMSSEVSYEER